MEFPNLYFKLRSTNYAQMPYTPDSVFRCIANGFKNRGTLQFTIVRDTAETEQLVKRRIKKFKHDISKYMNPERINVEVFPFSWQSRVEFLKKTKNYAMNKEYILTLSRMIEVMIIDYSPPSGMNKS